MTFSNLTASDAQRIQDVLDQLQASKNATARADAAARRAVAEAWWDTVKPAVPTTRTEALAVYNFILGLLQTETDADRLHLLGNKRDLAWDKYKTVKEANPNS